MTQTSNAIVGHTAGPWTRVERAIEADSPDRPGFGVVVAWVSDDVDESMARANGHLIASAPEMYEEFRRQAADCTACRGTGVEQGASCPECRQVRRMIAKAEGREPLAVERLEAGA